VTIQPSAEGKKKNTVNSTSKSKGNKYGERAMRVLEMHEMTSVQRGGYTRSYKIKKGMTNKKVLLASAYSRATFTKSMHRVLSNSPLKIPFPEEPGNQSRENDSSRDANTNSDLGTRVKTTSTSPAAWG